MTWGAVALSLAGLAVLSLSGLSVGFGQAVTFVAALLYALHIVGLGAWSDARPGDGHDGRAARGDHRRVPRGGPPRRDRAAPEHRRLAVRARTWRVFAGALALAGQTWAQAHLPATRTAIIMTMEPVFAALFAVLLGGEQTTAPAAGSAA